MATRDYPLQSTDAHTLKDNQGRLVAIFPFAGEAAEVAKRLNAYQKALKAKNATKRAAAQVQARSRW